MFGLWVGWLMGWFISQLQTKHDVENTQHVVHILSWFAIYHISYTSYMINISFVHYFDFSLLTFRYLPLITTLGLLQHLFQRYITEGSALSQGFKWGCISTSLSHQALKLTSQLKSKTAHIIKTYWKSLWMFYYYHPFPTKINILTSTESRTTHDKTDCSKCLKQNTTFSDLHLKEPKKGKINKSQNWLCKQLFFNKLTQSLKFFFFENSNND